MLVVIHQAMGMAEPATPIDDVRQEREKRRAIPIVRHCLHGFTPVRLGFQPVAVSHWML